MRPTHLDAGSSAVLHLECLELCIVDLCIASNALFCFEEEAVSRIIVAKGVKRNRRTIHQNVTSLNLGLVIGVLYSEALCCFVL